MDRHTADGRAATAADQLESLTRLREASALFADAVIRAQTELRGTLATECQRLSDSGSPRTAELTRAVEQGVMLMIRQLVESASGWRKQHDEQVEAISAELSDQFKANGQRPPRRPRGKSGSAALADETEVERLQRVSGQALKEKDGELRHAVLRALQEKAALQEQLSAAQRDVRKAAESEARRISELHREMKMQAGRIGDLESRLAQTLQEPPPQLLPPPPRLSPMAEPLAPVQQRPAAAAADPVQGREFGNLSAVLPGQSTPISSTPAAAQTPGGSVKFGGVTALDTESGLWTYAAMNFSPDGTAPAPAAAAAAVPTVTARPSPSPPVQVRAAARTTERVSARPSASSSRSTLGRSSATAAAATRGAGQSAAAAVEPAAAAAAAPPPPPPEVLLSAPAAELIAQTAAHVAQNGESFVTVLLSQGPEFHFLKPPPGAKLDPTAALGNAYYTNCLRYELAKSAGQRSGSGDLKGVDGMAAALGRGGSKRRAKAAAPRVEEISSGEEGSDVTGW